MTMRHPGRFLQELSMARNFLWKLLTGITITGGAMCALAQATGGPSASEVTPPQARRPPEQAAIDACSGRQVNERVRFVDEKGKRRYYPCVTRDGVLAARSGAATASRSVPR
jgi:hypothetical protein